MVDQYFYPPPMGCKACTERQCLYKGALYLFLPLFLSSTVFFAKDGATRHLPLPVCTWFRNILLIFVTGHGGKKIMFLHEAPIVLHVISLFAVGLKRILSITKRTLNNLNKNFWIIFPPILLAFQRKRLSVCVLKFAIFCAKFWGLFWVQAPNISAWT